MQHSLNIIELLKDTAFPQMLLIDGNWGSGKTYYIKADLMPELMTEFSDHELHYFSLYGIASIDDFRDRLISLNISDKSKKDSKNAPQPSSQLFNGLAKSLTEKGIGGLLNGAAGAYKYKLYSELDNKILILDDLERVSDAKTIRDILGECLNLTESKNIKIIVAANESKLSCQDDVEKVFIDKIKFGYSAKNIALKLKNMFPNELSGALSDELALHINTTGSTNIRVLKRALSKFSRLKENIEKLPNVAVSIALSNILRQVIKICYAKFEGGYSAIEIKESALRYVAKRRSTTNGIELNEQQKSLDSLLGGDGVHAHLIDFCCDGLYNFMDLVQELQLPVDRHLLDKVANSSLRHQLTEQDFNAGIEELITLIDSTDDINIDEWFNACDLYINLLDNKFIAVNYTKADIIEICQGIAIESFDLSKVPSADSWNNFSSHEVYGAYVDKLAAVRELIKLNENSTFSDIFNLSWTQLEQAAYRELSYQPFIQKIGVENFITAIENWTSDDVHSFAGYMREKYSFGNIEAYFIPEHHVISEIIPRLTTLLTSMEPGLKAGSIINLKNELFDINQRMNEKLMSKQRVNALIQGY